MCRFLLATFSYYASIKYLLRPMTKRLPQQLLFDLLERIVPGLLVISQFLGRMSVLGRIMKRLVPVADYTGIYPLTQIQLREWALLDTFDMLGPQYDSPQSEGTIRSWMATARFKQIEVLHVNLLVIRGLKSKV